MKFDLQRIRSVRSFRRNQKSNSSFDSDHALEAVDDIKKSPKRSPKKSPKKESTKRVTFAEDRNQEYPLKPQTQSELSKLWYSEKDVLRFEYETIQTLGQWLEQCRNANSLQELYQGFHELDSDDLEELLQAKRRMRLKEEDVGLDMILLYGLPSNIHNKSGKRKRCLKHVTYFQKKNVIAANPTKELATAISAESRASVLYATYVAEKYSNV